MTLKASLTIASMLAPFPAAAHEPVSIVIDQPRPGAVVPAGEVTLKVRAIATGLEKTSTEFWVELDGRAIGSKIFERRQIVSGQQVAVTISDVGRGEHTLTVRYLLHAGDSETLRTDVRFTTDSEGIRGLPIWIAGGLAGMAFVIAQTRRIMKRRWESSKGSGRT